MLTFPRCATYWGNWNSACKSCAAIISLTFSGCAGVGALTALDAEQGCTLIATHYQREKCLYLLKNEPTNQRTDNNAVARKGQQTLWKDTTSFCEDLVLCFGGFYAAVAPYMSLVLIKVACRSSFSIKPFCRSVQVMDNLPGILERFLIEFQIQWSLDDWKACRP